MLGIFFAKNCFVFDTPINTEGIIEDRNASIRLWCIEIIALVLEYSCFTQYGKAMCKTTRHKELAVVILG